MKQGELRVSIDWKIKIILIGKKKNVDGVAVGLSFVKIMKNILKFR